ncbi:substrate-binding periplasmic protein [Pseudoalteromonas pernae]|uniref:substrate-binding periplasmic protein n=2 Tax=Pseudoalteromonas pernae TaxID=3118054 RepID=UPI003242CA9E
MVTELSPPNQILINGKVAGSSTDIVNHVLQEADIESHIRVYPWARAFHIAKRMPNTLIYSVAKTPERESQFHWLGKVAYFRLGFVSLTQRDDIKINKFEDAKAYRIAVQRGDISALYLAEKQFAIVETTDIKQSYQLLISKKVDLVIDDPQYINSMSQHFNLAPTQLSFIKAIDDLSVYGYLAANKDTDPQLIKRLQKAFEIVEKTSWYQQKLLNPYYNIEAFND